MFFISMLAVVVVCAHLWVGLAAPVPDIGTREVQVAGTVERGFPWGSGGDDRYRFGVPVDASDDPVKDSRAFGEANGTSILQFGVAGDEALELPPSSQTVVA